MKIFSCLIGFVSCLAGCESQHIGNRPKDVQIEEFAIDACPTGTSRATEDEGNSFGCVRPNGTKHGPWRFWNLEVRRFDVGSFENGRKQGPWAEYQAGGEYLDFVQYDAEKWRGPMRHSGVYDHGKRTGVWTVWFDGVNSSFIHNTSWTRWIQGNYVNGERQGTWHEFRPPSGDDLMDQRIDPTGTIEWREGIPDFVYQKGWLVRMYDCIMRWGWFCMALAAIFVFGPMIGLAKIVADIALWPAAYAYKRIQDMAGKM